MQLVYNKLNAIMLRLIDREKFLTGDKERWFQFHFVMLFRYCVTFDLKSGFKKIDRL